MPMHRFSRLWGFSSSVVSPCHPDIGLSVQAVSYALTSVRSPSASPHFFQPYGAGDSSGWNSSYCIQSL